MAHHQLPETTHTLELHQLAQLNAQLATEGRPITAAGLGLSGVRLRSAAAGSLPATAVLCRLSWEGPPEFPYVYGLFTATAGTGVDAATMTVEVHTAALQELNRLFGLHQRWGV